MTNGAVRGAPPRPSNMAFPSRGALTVAFAHVAYRAAEEFAARRTGVAHFEVRTLEELERRACEADVLAVSGLWRNSLLASATKLRLRTPGPSLAPARIPSTICEVTRSGLFPLPASHERRTASG